LNLGILLISANLEILLLCRIQTDTKNVYSTVQVVDPIIGLALLSVFNLFLPITSRV
jgi:hypothetical protein